jgi:hypothetical protein
MDNFPWRWFLPRTLDISLSLLAIILILESVFFAALKIEASGFVVLIIGMYSEYRQNSHYSVSPIENSLISGELTHTPVHQIAKARSRIAKINIVIMVVGTIMTAWGVLA